MRNYEIEDNMYRKAVELIEKKVSCRLGRRGCGSHVPGE
jgi:hypothetical protein